MKKKGLLASILICGILASSAPAMAGEIYAVGNSSDYHNTGYYDLDGRPVVETNTLPVTIHIDGYYTPSDVDPVIINGRTMIPLRLAGEALGAKVSWNGLTQIVSVIKGTTEVYFYIGRSYYYVNGEERHTDVAPMLSSDRTLLPLRAFAEALNAEVDWDGNTYDVSIDTEAVNAPAPNVPAGTPEELKRFVEKFYVHPDSTDARVGSWYLSDADYTSDEANCQFVSKLGAGYQVIAISYYKLWFAPIYTIYITRDDGWGEPNNVLTFKYDQWPIYYRGIPFSVRSWADTQDYYTEYNNNLIRTQRYYIEEGTYSYSKAVYSRF